MGLYVHWQLSFAGNDGVKVKDIARQAMARVKDDDDVCNEAKYALECLSTDKALFCGPKGDVWMCGQVGNYSRGDDIVKDLWWFFEQLWEQNAMFDDHDRIILFVEYEQSESVDIHVIENPTCEGVKLVHRKHSSGGEWAWGQY